MQSRHPFAHTFCFEPWMEGIVKLIVSVK